MRHPLNVSSFEELILERVPLLDLRLQESLRKLGIQSLFPVQSAVWHQMVGPGNGERDLSICSPTGSGKTLAYALPITHSLSTRVFRHLRALVVVPSRDLAIQVRVSTSRIYFNLLITHAVFLVCFNTVIILLPWMIKERRIQVKHVFDAIAPAVGLSVGIAVGQTSVTTEAAQLVHFPAVTDSCFREIQFSDEGVAESRVDILVATPGRLMDHIQNTPGFTLQHLQYLVVDEIDRLLREAYQEWLPTVLEAAGTSNSASMRTIRRLCPERGTKGCVIPRVKKMILSATLTRDPAKIAQLGLYHPLSIAMSTTDHLYKLPELLESYKIICKAGSKPLKLVALLQVLGQKQRSVIFTSSVSNTHRLFTFLSVFEELPVKVVEYSSFQHQLVRSKALAAFKAGEAQVLVASDAMARGMDVEDVSHIINYDPPAYAKTYVHRVGRTARAGKSGCSFTLLRKEEVRHFKSILGKVQKSSCRTYKVSRDVIGELHPRYTSALDKLKEALDEDGNVD